MKILIIGVSGAGKSTLARELGNKYQLPVLHLDQVWHKTNYDEEGKELLKQTQVNFMKDNLQWIVDGNYSGTMNLRIPEADIIIWLKISKLKSLWRVVIRSLKTRLGVYKREDIAETFKEKFDKEYVEFLKFIWYFEKNNYPKIEEALFKRNENCQLYIIQKKDDIQRFMTKLDHLDKS